MDEEIIEIDQIEDGHVVLAIPSLRLIVMGRTIDEARIWARSAIAHRDQATTRSAEPSPGTNEETRSASSNAA